MGMTEEQAATVTMPPEPQSEQSRVRWSRYLRVIQSDHFDADDSSSKRKKAKAKIPKKQQLSRQFTELSFTPSLMACLDRFTESLAGYCVATYVLGIGDRHPSNLLLTSSGKFLHIDFGHFLGHFKTKYGFKRETAPFVFTPQFAAVFGGGQGTILYRRFENLCCDAFIELRQRSELLITLFSLMLGSGIPQLQRKSDILWLRQKLMPELSTHEARREFKALIEASVKCERTQFNNFCHVSCCVACALSFQFVRLTHLLSPSLLPPLCFRPKPD